MKNNIFSIGKMIIKVYCILAIILTNIINILYCIFWKPDNDHIKTYLAGGQNNVDQFMSIIKTCNYYAHKNSLFLFILLLLMVFMKEKFRLLIVLGLLTIAGLFIQLSFFDILY